MTASTATTTGVAAVARRSVAQATGWRTGRRLLIAGSLAVTALLVTLPMMAMGTAPPPRPPGSRAVPVVAGEAAAAGLPDLVLHAYQSAAARSPETAPGCAVPWFILAAVGRVESGNAAGRTIGPNGDITPPIIGINLDGTRGNAAVADTDHGRWDHDTTWDHAVGPMQFIPGTWQRYGIDGNDDGVINPENIYDAAATAAAYLCDSGGPMATEADWRRGLLGYNHSAAYANAVLQAASTYRTAPAQRIPNAPAGPIQLVNIPGIGRTNKSWATQVQAMLAAAEADGVRLTGGSYRDSTEQIALRRAHCGTSHYAIYEMPASQCRPPTARPGQSMHERGLAIDFNNCSTRSNACYRWLAANASRFGIHPLASEPWHWSLDGR